MGFSCGLVGLPNVGKSTLFNALTRSEVEAQNYPFCTIDPHVGVVPVPDMRLNTIAKYIPTRKITPTHMVFVDIAGLVKGASKGEGLGNQFLSHIRETQVIAHIVRCFEDKNIAHVEGSIDPVRDLETIELELILADLQTIQKKLTLLEKKAKGGDSASKTLYGLLLQGKSHLENARPLRTLCFSPEEWGLLKEFHFLTQKNIFCIANIDEASLSDPYKNVFFQKLMTYAQERNILVIALCAKIESELSLLSSEEQKEFLSVLGLEEPSLHRVIREGYGFLKLLTFFTAGEKEIRAWTVRKGAKAPQAAGVIHSDFERGFIRAEVYHYRDLQKHHSVAAIREEGLLRLEGKDYVMEDGDVVYFRFHV